MPPPPATALLRARAMSLEADVSVPASALDALSPLVLSAVCLDEPRRRWAVRVVAAGAASDAAWAVRMLQALDLDRELKMEALAETQARAKEKVDRRRAAVRANEAARKARAAARREQIRSRKVGKAGKAAPPDQAALSGDEVADDAPATGDEVADDAPATGAAEQDAPPLHFSVLLALSRCIGAHLSGSDVLELCDGDVARSAWSLLVLLERGASLPDGKDIAVLGTRLLFSLTTFEAHCGDATEVATSKQLKELTSGFARRNTELLRAVMELDAFDSIAGAIHPLFSRGGTAAEAHAASRHACRLVHNLLLFSTESSCQLRKCLAHSQFFAAVLDPHLDAVARARDLDALPALKALCAITCKVGLLRQHCLANSQLFVTLLGTKRDDATAIELVCRVACNLGLLRAPGAHVMRLREALEAAVAGLSAETRASAGRRFWIDTATAPVTRGEETHDWVVSMLGEAPEAVTVVVAAAAEAPSDGSNARQRRNRRRRQQKRAARTTLADKLVEAVAETRKVQVQPRAVDGEAEEAGEGWSDFDVDDVLDELELGGGGGG